jgi:putative transposase
MPRTAPPGYCYHVLNRAALRARIFRGPDDYDAFEGILARAKAVVPVRLFAFCVMPNHWHLVVEPREAGDLSRFVQRLAASHAHHLRSVYATTGEGAVYQSRFKSFPIQTDRHFLTVVRYVEQNPTRAGLVARSADWRWSSRWWRARPDGAARLLDPPPIPLPEDWGDEIGSPGHETEIVGVRRSVARGAPFGDRDWQERTARALHLDSTLKPIGRPSRSNTATQLSNLDERTIDVSDPSTSIEA